jgi:hypothetical protein
VRLIFKRLTNYCFSLCTVICNTHFYRQILASIVKGWQKGFFFLLRNTVIQVRRYCVCKWGTVFVTRKV